MQKPVASGVQKRRRVGAVVDNKNTIVYDREALTPKGLWDLRRRILPKPRDGNGGAK